MRLFCNGSRIENATWNDVEAALPNLKKEADLVLTIRPEPESGPRKLAIQSENGNYMATMMNVDETGKSYNDPSASGKERIEIGGYDYDPSGVTQDYDLIVRIIKEFFHTRNVSPELWRPQPKDEG